MIKYLSYKNLLFFALFIFLGTILTAIYAKHLYIYNVKSGSMEKNIHKSSLILVVPQKNYTVKQIVTYKKGNVTVTHRIMSIEGSLIRTKGDANNSLDLDPITKNEIVGRVFLVLPFGGFLTSKYFLIGSFLILGLWYGLPQFKKSV